MGFGNICFTGKNSELLFFVIVFLLLFYDGSAIGLPGRRGDNDSDILFFLLVFLLLFFRNND